MKKFQARRERQHQEAIVGSIEIEDPSAELFSASRSWQSDDPLQDSFLEHSEPTPPAKEEHFRLPKLKFNRTLEGDLSPFDCSPTFQDDVSDTQQEDEIQKSADVPAPLFTQSAAYVAIMPPSYSSEPEVVSERESSVPPAIPQKNPNRTTPLPIRSRSLPPSRDISSLSVSPPKTNFQVFSQRCAPSPTSASPLATSPVFELSAEDVMFSLAGSIEADSPVELEGSPVDSKTVYTVPLHYEPMHAMEQEPEASPYNRFTALAKSIHTLNANLSPIEETEEEAASRRSSMAKIYELPGTLPPTSFAASAYSGGSTITPRSGRYLPNTMPDTISIPMRTTSMRSYDSANSTNSAHSMFSFEFTNSDTEKIYIVPCSRRRESSAPSLTDVSSVDDFDVDLELNPRRSRSVTKSDVKLERFFGIRQFSVSTSSDLSPTTSSSESPASSTESVYERERGRTSLSIDDLELSLALENDPYRREIIAIHKSILSKSQSKQDAKLEKFFGCDKDEIQVARKSSTGSRLAGCTDDLKYRSIGW